MALWSLHMQSARCWAALLLAAMLLGSSSFLLAQPPEGEAMEDGTPAMTAEDAVGQVKLPKLEELVPPTPEELLRGPRRDWVILLGDEVIVSEPIVPRPRTMELLEEAYKKKEKERGTKTDTDAATFRRELDELRYLNLVLPGPPPMEVRVVRTKVVRIVHHEDHMLNAVDKLLDQNQIELANELIVQLQRDWPEWPGLAERRHRLLFVDASERLTLGDPEACMMLSAELKGQSPDYPGLSELAGQATDLLVSDAQEANDHVRARHGLFRLDNLFPGHPVFQRLSQGYAAQAQELMAKATEAGKAGRFAEAATLATEAVRFWPRLVALKGPHKQATERYQRLPVGVVHLSGDPRGTPFEAEADVRQRRMGTRDLFEVEDFRGGIPHFRTRYFDEWEPFDLGRRMRFTLSQTRQPWESQPELGAGTLADILLDAVDPASAHYDERLASYLKSVTLSSPTELDVTFQRVPVRIESVLRSVLQHGLTGQQLAPLAEQTLQPVTTTGSAQTDLTGGFTLASSEPDQRLYLRSRPEPVGLDRYHVTEVIEKRYTTHEKALRGLQEGEVLMLPDLPDWIIRRIQADKNFEKDFFIQKYSLPTTHILQLNPKSRPLAYRELRRALFQSIDRERFLAEIVLQDPVLLKATRDLAEARKARGNNDPEVQELVAYLRDLRISSHGRLASSPFASSSYAVTPRLTSQPFDLSSSVAMAIAVGQQLGGEIPVLRMVVPPEEIPQQVAARLVKSWARIGITVEIVPPGDTGDWDLAYRTTRLDDPLTDLWKFLTAQPEARVADLEPFPDWLKQELIALDRAPDWNRVVELSQTLHRHLWADVRFIPLWEVDGYMVYRKNLRGVPTSPLHCYEQLDRWVVEAWYALDAN